MVGTEELRMLWASIVLGLVQLTMAMVAGLASGRLAWNVGARDQEPPQLGKIAARIERAWRNYLETFPFFAALVLLSAALSKHNAMTTLGADLYLYSRVIHVALYVIGVPVVRTIVFSASLVGIILVLFGIWPG